MQSHTQTHTDTHRHTRQFEMYWMNLETLYGVARRTIWSRAHFLARLATLSNQLNPFSLIYICMFYPN